MRVFFYTMAKIWKSEKKGSTFMQKWQNKIRRLRYFLSGWANNLSGSYKKGKTRQDRTNRDHHACLTLSGLIIVSWQLLSR